MPKLIVLKNFKHKSNPFLLDKNFKIQGRETNMCSPDTHLIDNIIEIFNDNNLSIIIKYDTNDFIKAACILLIRITDPHFYHKNLKINNKIYSFDSIMDTSINIINKITIEEISNVNVIEIICASTEDYEYAKSVLIYTSNSKFENTYNLNKELDRWDLILNNKN